VLTAVAWQTQTFTIRPPSLTLTTRASTIRYGYGPMSSGRVRKPSTISSSSPAKRLTWLLDMPWMPSWRTTLSTRRVLTPARYRSATTETSARSDRDRGSNSQCG
jgi:hypothetical protein